MDIGVVEDLHLKFGVKVNIIPVEPYRLDWLTKMLVTVDTRGLSQIYPYRSYAKTSGEWEELQSILLSRE